VTISGHARLDAGTLRDGTPAQETTLIRTLALTLALAATIGLPTPAPAADQEPVVSYAHKAKFEDVRDDLKAAIESRGLVIDFESHIHQMLERTGKDLGATAQPFANAEAVLFCSAQLSRRMMEADPANVVFCPYTITVYVSAQAPDTVVVTYRRPWRTGGSPPSQAALREVERLLDGVAREALGLPAR
jgi:uncharacterized protein (DUF302 family)